MSHTNNINQYNNNSNHTNTATTLNSNTASTIATTTTTSTNNNKINIYENPVYFPYFYGRLLREEAEKILMNRGCQDGLFLLRELIQEVGSYALSICFQREVHHYRIDRQDDDEGSVKIDKGRSFLGPVELIKHHQREQDGLITKPKVPCER